MHCMPASMESWSASVLLIVTVETVAKLLKIKEVRIL